jgi:aldose sugar dehydrogenase
MHYSSLVISVSLAAMLVLANPMANSLAAHAQQAAVPSVLDAHLKVEKVVDGLSSPTTMAFLDEHRILTLEKDKGTVRMIKDGELLPEPLLKVQVANSSYWGDESGMLGIAVSKGGAEDSSSGSGSTNTSTKTYVFLYFTQAGGQPGTPVTISTTANAANSGSSNQEGFADPVCNCLYRYELQDNNHLVHPKLLLDLPATPGPRYDGGPIAIGPDGYVYVVIGDVDGHKTKAENFQNGSAPDGTGGILRVGQDGEVPPSVIGEGTFSKYYYAYGIRNSFGLAFDPISGNLWDTENGPDTGDEVNLVKPGFNSGWQVVTGKISSSSELLNKLELFNGKGHYSNPEFSWNQTVAPTAIDFFNSSNFGDQYQGNAFVGDYNGGEIYSFKLNETRTGFVLPPPLVDHVSHSYADDQYVLFGNGFGGVTDLKTGPDGCLYVSSFYQGAIYRILPATENNTISR